MSAENDIVERLQFVLIDAERLEHTIYTGVELTTIREAAAEIVRLRGEVERRQGLVDTAILVAEVANRRAGRAERLAPEEAEVSAIEVFRIAGGDTECCPNPTTENALDCLRDLRQCYDEAIAPAEAKGDAHDCQRSYSCPACARCYECNRKTGFTPQPAGGEAVAAKFLPRGSLFLGGAGPDGILNCDCYEIRHRGRSFLLSPAFHTPPAAPAQGVDAVACDAVEAAAIKLWHRFAIDYEIEWDECSEQAVYLDAARDVLAGLTTPPAAQVQPVCPETGCGAQVLFECPACSSTNYPPREAAQVQPCDMGALCIGCTPRNADGLCPGTPQPAGGEAVAPVFYAPPRLVENCHAISDVQKQHRVVLSTEPDKTYSEPLYATPPAAQVQQQAAAYVKREGNFLYGRLYDDLPEGTKLYAHPAAGDKVRELVATDLEFTTWPEPVIGGMHVGCPKGIKAIHKPTGITVICDAERSQHKNRDICILTLEAALSAQEKAS